MSKATVRYAERVIKMYKAGFIGCGNMGGALASAAVKAVGEQNVIVSDADNNKTKSFKEKYGAFTGSVKDVINNSEYIFLGVKPQMLKGLFNETGEYINERKDRFVLVSMAAGVSIASIKEMAGKDVPVIRIMPNMPVSTGEGVVLFTTDGVSDDEKNEFKSIMKCAGLVDEIEEAKIDAASCISGCGPAFVYMFIEALADGGVACGLPRDKAIAYASHTLSGASKTVLESGEHPEKLKDMVCSPAGSTIEGVKALEKGAFRSDVINAVVDSYKRTLELGK